VLSPNVCLSILTFGTRLRDLSQQAKFLDWADLAIYASLAGIAAETFITADSVTAGMSHDSGFVPEPASFGHFVRRAV
jgi:hypothetical protein